MTFKLTPSNASELEAQLEGELSLPGMTGYQDAIYTWNAWIRHRPDFVITIASARDAQIAFRFAAMHKIPVAVQSSGHGAVMTIDGGMLISTRRLNNLVIDPVTKMATVGAAVRWHDIMQAGAPHGLAGASGSSSDVGVVGYMLGGGMSIIGRKFGWGADHVESIEIVTPDGILRHLSAQSEPDLFWAVRGGAGNFGVVTELTFKLLDIRTVYGGGLFFDSKDAAAILGKYFEWTKTVPDEMCSSIAIMWLPPVPELPEPLRGRTVIGLRACYVGPAAEGERLFAPMREFAPALLDGIREMPWTAADFIYMDPKEPIPFQQRGALFTEVTSDTINAMLEIAGPDTRIPMMLLDIRHLEGAFGRSHPTGNAVCGRDAKYMLSAVALSTPETEQAAGVGLNQVVTAVSPWCTGRIFVNSAGVPTTEEDRARSWEEATYRKICDLVQTVDPQGLIQYGFAVGRTARAA